MLRTTMIAFAAATTIGGFALASSTASAAPLNGSVITVRVYESGTLQPVWYRRYYHRYWYRHHRRWWW